MTWRAAAALGCIALASGIFLEPKTINTVVVQAPALDDIMQSLVALDKAGADGDDKEVDSELAKEVEDVVTKEKDPASKVAVEQLTNIIMKKILPARAHSLEADQKQLDDQMGDLERCHLDERVKLDMNVYSKLESAEDHKDDYKDSRKKHGMCLEILEGKKMVMNAYCSSTEDVAALCHCDERMVKFFGQRNKDCDSYPAISEDDTKCCDAYYEHERHEHDCETAHLDAQYAQKQHAIIMGKLCDAYETCYDRRLKVYQRTEELAKASQHRKNNVGLHRMKCLVQEFEKGKVSKEAAKACKEKDYDIKGLNYPAIPPKEQCKTEVQWHAVAPGPL